MRRSHPMGAPVCIFRTDRFVRTIPHCTLRWFFLALVLSAASVSQKARAQTAQPASIQFTNATAAAGIKFVHYPGNKGMAIIREVFGPGVCVADFD